MLIINNYKSWFACFLLASFFFMWGIDHNRFYLDHAHIINYNFRYNILLLLVPILFKVIKVLLEKKFIFFFNQYLKIVIIFSLILIFHVLLTSYLYKLKLNIQNLYSISFLVLLLIIYIFYRNFMVKNLDKIIYIFIFFLFLGFILGFSFEPTNPINNYCSQKYFEYFQTKSGFLFSQILDYNGNSIPNFTNVLFKENSHLGMLLPAVIYYLIYKSENNYKYLLLIFPVFFISLFFLSTTYLCSLIIVGFISIFYVRKKKKKIKIILISLFFISISTLLILSDKECSKKITGTNLNINEISEQNHFNHGYNEFLLFPYQPIDERMNNSTSAIYERSILVSIDTFKNKFLGWGYGNNDIATEAYLEKYLKIDSSFIFHGSVLWLNFKDGLGNLFKLTTEFGFFSLIIFYYFYMYIRDNKITYPHKIFFISIFIVQLCRAAGYLNGGFCLALFEILFYKSLIKNKNLIDI